MNELEKLNLKALEKFNKALNNNPKASEVQANPYAGNSKYLPISFIEMTLDELFFGLWETINFKSQIVMNEIIGSIELRVFHPTAKTWLTRTGTASTPIQMSKGSGVTSVEKKIHNTLVKDYPHLKTECIKNAAKSLGKAFGRDLNRVFEDQYSPFFMKDFEPISENQKALIDNLLHSSILDEPRKQAIESQIFEPNFSFEEAGLLIEMLQNNQKKGLDQQFKEATE